MNVAVLCKKDNIIISQIGHIFSSLSKMADSSRPQHDRSLVTVSLLTYIFAESSVETGGSHLFIFTESIPDDLLTWLFTAIAVKKYAKILLLKRSFSAGVRTAFLSVALNCSPNTPFYNPNYIYLVLQVFQWNTFTQLLASDLIGNRRIARSHFSHI